MTYTVLVDLDMVCADFGWPHRTVLTHDKSRIRGHVLIDDWPACVGVERAEWTQIVFDQPYNRQVTGWRLSGWEPLDEALALIEDCCARVATASRS